MPTFAKANENEPIPTLSEIGDNIRKWRTLMGIKQEDLAQQLGITRVALSKIESGKTDIPIRRIIDIAVVLKLKIHILLSDPCQLIQQI
jgi:transcriptional regulator with XRE-family HTH domain